MSNILEEEILFILNRIDNGSLSFRNTSHPTAQLRHIITANGWRLRYFVDAGMFDYVDYVEDPRGREAEYEDLELMPLLCAWYPKFEKVWVGEKNV